MDIQSSNGLFPPQLNSPVKVSTCGGGKRRKSKKMRKSKKVKKVDCNKLLKTKSVQDIKNKTAKMLCNKKCMNIQMKKSMTIVRHAHLNEHTFQVLLGHPYS